MEREVLQLKEYQPVSFPSSQIPPELGERLWREFGDKVNVEFPSPATGGQWRITPQGWVGFIPLSPDFALMLQPKVQLQNLFGMWEYAYRLSSFHFFADLYNSQSLQQFYSQLAGVLARRVLDRGRRGYYRAYIPQVEDLPYLRGQLDLRKLINSPWDTRVTCQFEEHTADVSDNQILAWTLFVIARSGLCEPSTTRVVRSAYRNLESFISLAPYRADECIDRLYNRLNQDYQPLHALCRFFLDQTGPQLGTGDLAMLPFLVNMAGLFEVFVAEWLRKYLPAGYSLHVQERVDIAEGGQLFFRPDLVLYDDRSKALAVLDTKYKTPQSPAADDVAKVVAYAQSKSCREAVLIYPSQVPFPVKHFVGNIRVRSLSFRLDGDLEENGQKFLADLLEPLFSGITAL